MIAVNDDYFHFFLSVRMSELYFLAPLCLGGNMEIVLPSELPGCVTCELDHTT